MSVIDESLVDDKDYWVNLHSLFKHKINNPTDPTALWTPVQMAVALCNVKLRDAMLRTFFEEEDTLNNFITWWNDNNSYIKSTLTKEQKANLLPLLAGAMLLQKRWEEAETAIKLSISYAKEASILPPSLTNLINYAMAFGKAMNRREDVLKDWRKSIEAVKLEEIFNQ